MKRPIKLILGNSKLMFQILFTLFIIFLFCLGNSWDLPLTPPKIPFSWGGSQNFFLPSNPIKIFGLGIYPYITASIVVQFLQKLLPLCREWKDQGQIGKRKLNLLTRVLALLFAFGQSFALLQQFNNEGNYFFLVLSATTGVAILIWFADLINSKGIGNGTSILIMASMVNSLNECFKELKERCFSNSNNDIYNLNTLIFVGVVILLLLFLIITVIIQITSLKIPIHYARNHTKSYSCIPLKINSAGVLPVILASALFQPLNILSQSINNSRFTKIVNFFTELKLINFAFSFFVLLIIVFSFFSTFMSVNPEDISEHLSKQDAYIAGLRPGEQTTRYLAHVLFKITVMGTFFIVLLVIMPHLMDYYLNLRQMKVGGTSLLIIVSVAIETIQRIMATASKKEYAKLF